MTSVAGSTRTAAATLVEFCAGLRWVDLDPDVQARTRELLLDLLGVALAGSRQPSSRPTVKTALRLGGAGGSASVIGAGAATSVTWAALANGTAAHAVELDDVT